MKKFTLLIVLLFTIVSVLVACGEESSVTPVENNAGDEDNVEEKKQANNEAENESNENEVVEKEDLSVGTTIDFDGLNVALKKAYKYDGDPDALEEPENDYFIILDVSIENTTDESANISSMLQMSLLDQDSYSQEMGIMVDTKGSLNGEIGAGRTMAGEVAFDVVESDFYEFIFEDPFTSGQAIWKINVEDLEER